MNAIGQTNKQDTAKINSLNGTGINFQRSNVDSAIYYHNKATALAKKINDDVLLGESIKNTGFDYYLNGDYTKAMNCFEQSLKISEIVLNSNFNNEAKIRAKKLKRSVFGNIGVVFGTQNDYSKALEYFFKSASISEELKEDQILLRSYNNIGFIYKNLGEYDKSLEYFSKSLKIAESLNLKESLDNIYSGFGEVYSLKNENVTALNYYKKGLKISEETEDTRSTILNLVGIGTAEANLHEYDNALKNYLIAYNASKSNGNKYSEANVVRSITLLYLDNLKDFSSVKKYLSAWEILVKELNDPNEYRLYFEALSSFYDRTNQPDLALKYFKKYISLKDSLFGRENISKSLQQEFKISYEKKFTTDSVKAAEETKSANIKLELSEAKVKQEKTQKSILYGGLALVIIFSIFIFNRFKVTQKQKVLIEIKEKETQSQKHTIEEKQKEIIDSINYAKRIQHTLLAHNDFLSDNLGEHFVYFNPKDIVSGDFYWASKKDDRFYIAVCDSTGHGVPGAFMSLLNIGFLAEAINEKGIEKPNEVFDFVRNRLTDTISKEGQKDGFDGILVCIDQKNNTVSYSAANNKPILFHNGELTELLADRMPVGVGERKDTFSLYNVDMNRDSVLYLYTDGFADQFGGPKGKKFKYKQLNDLIQTHTSKPFANQKTALETTFSSWRGELEQVDDVCLIGFKIK
jgi:serine phosphatase RsbU (regulator of sigma subunit)